MAIRISASASTCAIGAVALVVALSQTAACAQSPSPSVTQGPGSAYSINQQGGITAGTVNIGPSRLVFSQQLGDELLRTLPREKKVSMTSVGGNADQAVASQIQQFLQNNGYTVERMAAGMLAPPPDHKISLRNTPDASILIVAPSAN